jgi:hypothetical protein
MTMQFRSLAEQAAADGEIDAAEILSLRRSAWPDGRISPDEAEAIFVVNDRIAAPTAEWSDFFTEALVEFIVNTAQPHGYVSEDNARWLIERIAHDGKVCSLTELELIVRVLEKSPSAAESLKLFALGLLEQAVLTGEGPTRTGENLDPGSVTSAECVLIRRTIFAAGSDRPAAVSQRERLFVQGVGNYLQGWQGAKELTRERAGDLEVFMDDRSSNLGGFFKRMAMTNANGFKQALREVGFGRHAPSRDVSGEAARDGAMTDSEKLWLDARIDADDKLDALEEALLRFLSKA